MTNQFVKTEADAIAILNQTRERPCLHAAIYMILPSDGTPLTSNEVKERVNELVDPIHALLANESDSYTMIEASGRRTFRAIRSAINQFSDWYDKYGKGGRRWIHQANGRIHYYEGGHEAMSLYFEDPENRPILEALTFMLELRNTPIDAEVKVITPEAELMAASESVDNPEPVEPAADPEDHRSWIDQLNDQVDEMDRKLDKIEAYDRTLALVKEVLDRRRKAGYGRSPMAETLEIVLESLERRE